MKVWLLLSVALGLLAPCTPAFAIDQTILTQSTLSCTGTSLKVINANLKRKYLLIVNNGTQTVYLKPEAAHSGTEGIPIPAGGNYEATVAPVNSFYCKSASGTQSLDMEEGN